MLPLALLPHEVTFTTTTRAPSGVKNVEGEPQRAYVEADSRRVTSFEGHEVTATARIWVQPTVTVPLGGKAAYRLAGRQLAGRVEAVQMLDFPGLPSHQVVTVA